MKKIYFLLESLVCCFIFWGCYEDLGHYDYIYANKVTVSLPSLTAVMGDTLKYTPTITFANPNDTLGFEYWWEYRGYLNSVRNRELICDGRELRFVPRVVGQQSVALCVKEIRSGYITEAAMTITGGSIYTKGWLILSEGDAGKSILSFILPDREISGNTSSARVYVPYLDLYSKLFPADNLGSGPVVIRQAFSTSGIGSIFYVLQKNESVCMNGVSYKKEIKLSQEFIGGAPADLDPVDYFHGSYSSMIVNPDGTIYYRRPYGDFFTYSFANFPMEYQAKKLKIDRIIPSMAERYYYFAVYDKDNKRFLWIYAGGSVGAGSIVKADFTTELAEYLDYNNTGDAEILYSTFYNEALSGPVAVAYNVTLYSRGGELYVQRCRGEGEQNLSVLPVAGAKLTEVQNNVFPGKAYITPNTKYYQLKTRTYLFFTTGGTVYWYDHLSREVYAFYTFAGDEVVDMSSNPQESELGVLLKSGKFVTLDILNEHLKGTNNKLYEIAIPGNRMVDLEYKFPDLNAYVSRTSAGRWD